MEILNHAFKLRECGDKFRVGPEVKPCLYYEIKRCDAPCALLQSKEDYRIEVRRLQEFLAAGDEGILAHVERLMRDAADRLDFEEAQFFKSRLFELRRVLGNGDRESASLSSNDFVILNPVPSEQCEVLFVRFGRLVKQAIVDSSHLPKIEAWFERQLRQYYGPTPVIPPSAGKPEIDEMRILSKWVEESKKKGTRIIDIERNWEVSTEKLVAGLHDILKSTDSKQAMNGTSIYREMELILQPVELSEP